MIAGITCDNYKIEKFKESLKDFRIISISKFSKKYIYYKSSLQ